MRGECDDPSFRRPFRSGGYLGDNGSLKADLFSPSCFFPNNFYIVKDVDENQTTSTAASDNSDSNAAIVTNMEGMIKTQISAIDRLKAEIEKLQGLLNDIFENDSTYKTHTEQAKEAARIKAATKQQILKQPQAADLDNKIKTFKSELKETQASLSDYLAEFQRMSGISEIEGEDGEMRTIVYTAKLVKASTPR